MKIDRHYLEQTLARLVQINSVNPTLEPGAPGERAIAEYLRRCCESFGMRVELLEPEPRRTSVLAVLAGTGGGRSLMLNGHLDTVAVGAMAEPFAGTIRDGRLYGRGAYDMKGSIAASIAAARAIAESGTKLRGNLALALVADEEYGSLGTRHLLARVRTDAAIVTEPTALRVCVAHKGYLWIEVAVTGRAAHGSRFELGIDANMKMGKFLAALGELEADLRARTPHPLVGPPSLHAALLEGGSGLSTYAALAKVQIERRLVPGEAEAQAVAEIQAVVDRVAAGDAQFQAEVRCYFARDPFEARADSGIVRTLDELLPEAGHMGDTPWMDAALCQAAGIDTVVFGPAGTGAHADVEWVDLDTVARTAEVLAQTALRYCA